MPQLGKDQIAMALDGDGEETMGLRRRKISSKLRENKPVSRAVQNFRTETPAITDYKKAAGGNAMTAGQGH